MEDNRQRGKKVFVGDLPQWNSRFRFSAQQHQDSKQEHTRATPTGLGQARRVPVAAPGAGAAADRHPNTLPKGTSKAAAGNITPFEADKTPTLCLFERFERLTLGTTPSTTLHTATLTRGSTPAAPAACETLGSAGITSTASSGESEQFVGRIRPVRRSVAFGTPSMLTYTPAGSGAAVSGDADNPDRTPLWSNAGHTPYSLAGSSGGGARNQQLDEDEGSDTDNCLLITAGAGVQRGTRGSRHSGVRMELFTTVLHGAPQTGAEHTPAGAAAALRCPWTPLVPDCADAGQKGSQGAAESASDGSEFGGFDVELPAPATTARAKAQAAPAAAGTDAGAAADSPSGSSSFTGFAGSGPSEQQAGGTTPTLFDCSRRGSDTSRPTASSLQHLLAGSCTGSHSGAGAAAGATAEASAGRTQGRQATNVLQAPIAVAMSAAGASAAQADSITCAAASSSMGLRPPVGAGHQHHLPFSAVERSPEPEGAAGLGGAWGMVGSTPQSLLPAATTPKSKLRPPERVAVGARMPGVPTELSKLLGDADAAAAAAALLGHGDKQLGLGSCELLSPVRARRQVQQALGASEQVLTPVRRSARKVKPSAGAQGTMAAAAVQPMLEATNYCYQPNEALQ